MPYKNIDGKIVAECKNLLTLVYIYGIFVLPLL